MATYGTGLYGSGTYGAAVELPQVFYTFHPRVAPDIVYPAGSEVAPIRRAGGRKAPIVYPDQMPGVIRRGR